MTWMKMAQTIICKECSVKLERNGECIYTCPSCKEFYYVEDEQ